MNSGHFRLGNSKLPPPIVLMRALWCSPVLAQEDVMAAHRLLENIYIYITYIYNVIYAVASWLLGMMWRIWELQDS